MQELITLGFGLVIGVFVGFNVGVRKVVDKAEAAAQNFIDALRDRFGSGVEREVGGRYRRVRRSRHGSGGVRRTAGRPRRTGRTPIQPEVNHHG